MKSKHNSPIRRRKKLSLFLLINIFCVPSSTFVSLYATTAYIPTMFAKSLNFPKTIKGYSVTGNVADEKGEPLMTESRVCIFTMCRIVSCTSPYIFVLFFLFTGFSE